LSRSRASYEKNLSLLSSMIYYALYLVIISALTTVAHLVAVEAPGAVLTLFANPFPLAAPTFLIGYILVGLTFPAAHAYIAYTAQGTAVKKHNAEVLHLPDNWSGGRQSILPVRGTAILPIKPPLILFPENLVNRYTSIKLIFILYVG
jgi:hypothetical protein